MRRLAMAILVGGLGCLVPASLGVWQLQRLSWKEATIAAIEARASSAPVAVPLIVSEAEHEYLPVRVAGNWGVGELHVLTSLKGKGPGYRVIAPFLTSDRRRILVDRGFVPQTAKEARRPVGGTELTGHLVWPDETDSFTPEPNLEGNIWFARDVARMATALETAPIMVSIARSTALGAPTPLPVTVALPNNHLAYALQWFGLAIVWAVMTVYYLRRTRAKMRS